MQITNTRTGRKVSSLWLIPLVPPFLVGCFFVAVTSLTCMAVGTTFLDGLSPGWIGPAPVGIDRAFVAGVFALDRRLVGLVGLSSPWWAVAPGFVCAAFWEWATGRRP